MGGTPGNFLQPEHLHHFQTFLQCLFLGMMQLQRAKSDFIQDRRAKELDIRILKKEAHPLAEESRKGSFPEPFFREPTTEGPGLPVGGEE